MFYAGLGNYSRYMIYAVIRCYKQLLTWCNSQSDTKSLSLTGFVHREMEGK